MSLAFALRRNSNFLNLGFFIRFTFFTFHTNQLWVIFHKLILKTFISFELLASINQKQILTASLINFSKILIYKLFNEIAGADLEIHFDWVLFQSFYVDAQFLPLNVSHIYSMDYGVLSQGDFLMKFLAPVEEKQ